MQILTKVKYKVCSVSFQVFAFSISHLHFHKPHHNHLHPHPHLDQVETTVRILNNLMLSKKPVVLVTTKADEGNDIFMREAERLV